jgi:hypothetical protein
MRRLTAEDEAAHDLFYDDLCANMTHQEIATRLAGERIGDEPFSAYKPPPYQDPPSMTDKRTTAIVFGSLGFFPTLLLAWAAIQKQAYGSAATFVLFGLGFYAFAYFCFWFSDFNAKNTYKIVSDNYNKWDDLSSMYFASVRKLLRQNVQPQEVLHDTYRPRAGEVLFLANRVALFAFRDRVTSRSQSGGVIHENSETLGHLEGVGLLAVTSKGLNFISEDHRSNIFLKWRDIAMTDTDARFLVVQPYSGKVRHFIFEQAGVNPASDPILNRLYIENVREMCEA